MEYFAGSLNRVSTSLVLRQRQRISKVYFPRLIIPLSGVIAGLVDFGVSFGVLVVLMALYRIAPTLRALLLPAFL